MLKNNQFNKLKNQTRMIFRSNFLKDLSTTERYEFLQLCHRRKYNKGEFIYYQDDPGTGMYFIEEGCVDLIVANSHDEAGKDAVTFKLEPPDSFGALSIGYDLRRLSAAKCVTDCILLGFFNPDFETLKKRNPGIAVKFLEKLSSIAMRQLERTIRELETTTSTQHVFDIQFQTYYDRYKTEEEPTQKEE